MLYEVITKEIVYSEYALLALVGLGLSATISAPFLYTQIFFLVMGFSYNVKPIRLKDKAS